MFELRNYVGGVLTLLVSGLFIVDCHKPYRRGTDEATDRQGGPGSKVEPETDPRFPHAGDASDRSGLWVEQPVEPGSISSTGLANAVADQLPEVQQRCCRGGEPGCVGLEGRLLVELIVNAGGEVTEARLTETSLYNREFQQCLLRQSRTWKVAQPTGNAPVEVVIPIGVRFVEAKR